MEFSHLNQTVKHHLCCVGEEEATQSTRTLPDGAVLPDCLSSRDVAEAGSRLLVSETTDSLFSFRNVYENSVAESSTVLPYMVCGGGSLMRGVNHAVKSHLQKYFTFPNRELTAKSPSHTAIDGGLILSQISSFKQMCVDVEEYNENGPARCCSSKMIDSR
ncbi:hypothetical protein AGDE_00893 [Angomonas deanei]|nr:hypothetical protein AGDE_09357 [Angomonas deanei]EPY43030.1 hypothetical protein AGDE_00893 [Angomonas deanei]|eukprot:EPY30610.1 hypothetical protein AGDE_09357 [Angomonas deanei]